MHVVRRALPFQGAHRALPQGPTPQLAARQAITRVASYSVATIVLIATKS
jgi:hypothetical protein